MKNTKKKDLSKDKIFYFFSFFFFVKNNCLNRSTQIWNCSTFISHFRTKTGVSYVRRRKETFGGSERMVNGSKCRQSVPALLRYGIVSVSGSNMNQTWLKVGSNMTYGSTQTGISDLTTFTLYPTFRWIKLKQTQISIRFGRIGYDLINFSSKLAKSKLGKFGSYSAQIQNVHRQTYSQGFHIK